MQYIAHCTSLIDTHEYIGRKDGCSMYTNEQLIEFCQEAVRIPSYSGQEKGVAEFMKR